jgi:F420-dependent oxidoreductase-like protein
MPSHPATARAGGEVPMRFRLTRRAFLEAAGAGALALLSRSVGQAQAVRTAADDVAADPPRAGRLRFGLQLRPERVAYRDLADAWREADGLGYDSLFLFDHLVPITGDPADPCHEGWTLLAALAPQTRQARIGLLVTGNTYRHPAVLAKMAATVDHASGGKLILGIGAGWFEPEHRFYGIPFHTAAGRARRFGEAVEVVKLLWTRERATFDGRYYRLANAPFAPKPLQRPHPPILVGGMGPKLVQPVAARHADIWHFFVRDQDDDFSETRALVRRFDELCRSVGRDPKAVEKSTSLRLEHLQGSPTAARDYVRRLADAGVGHFIIGLPAPYDRALVRRFAEEVMPALRAG